MTARCSPNMFQQMQQQCLPSSCPVEEAEVCSDDIGDFCLVFKDRTSFQVVTVPLKKECASREKFASSSNADIGRSIPVCRSN